MLPKRIGGELIRTAHLLTRIAPDEELGLTHMQGRALHVIQDRESEGAYQKDIERVFEIKRATASSLLARMERDGLITRNATEGDARVKRIFLTDKARALVSRIDVCIEQNEARLTGGMTEDEIAYLFKAFRKMQDNLGGTMDERMGETK